MPESPDPDILAPDLNTGGDIPSSEPKAVCRNLVQSTLLPCKSQENEANCNGMNGKECAVEVEDCGDGGECSGSQTKKKPQRWNRKTMPQSRTSKMEKRINVMPTKKGANNGHEGASLGQCSPIRIEDAPSLVVPGQKLEEANSVWATLFPCNSQEIEANGNGKNAEDENGADEEYCGSQKNRKRKGKNTSQARTPKKSKGRQLNTTPKKNRTSNGHAGTGSRQSSQVVIEKTSPPPIPNLRLEAKLMSEEISRIYSGKQIHPFFTSRKVGKKINETSEVEHGWSLVEQKDKHTDIGPIHVFESPQNDNASFNWRSWSFCEETSTSSQDHAKGSFSSIFEGSVKVFGFGNLLKNLYTSSFSHSQNEVCLDYHGIQKGHSHKISTVIADVTETKGSFIPSSHNSEVENGAREVHCLAGDAYKCRKLEIGQKSICINQPVDSLWTDKYQPRKAEEVCGNTESVKLLNEWLHSWHEVDIKNCRNSPDNDRRDIDDDDYGYYISDCDSQDMHEGAILKNVLLIKGPAGSGKTAAIYACAKEQGFRVLEANASECRNGAVLKHKFGEALLSFWRSRSTKKYVDSKSRRNNKLSFAPHKNGKIDPEKAIEVIPLSDEEDSNSDGSSEKMVNEKLNNAHDQGELKPLILLEDMDIVFPEDRGFLSAIKDIAETAKGPVILTSSIENPVLPDKMDRLEVCFKALPQRELFQHAHMVCISEKSKIHPNLLEKLIECCRGDIRKTIMCLQYFCLGGNHDQDGNLQWLCDPLHFDLAAGHQLLPIIFPWNFPSQLSELVEKEISESASRLTKHSNLTDVFNEITEETETTELQKGVVDCIEAKKEAMLSRNFTANDCNVLATLLDNADKLSNSSGTPVAFSRRNARRTSDTVMTSDSEDEFFKGGLVSTQGTDYELFPKADCKGHSSQRASQDFLFPLAYENRPPEAMELDEQHPLIEAATELNLNDTSMLCDVSLVPESSFVPETVDETEQICKTVSCGHVANTMEVSVNNEIKSLSFPLKADIVDQFAPVLHQNSDAYGHGFNVNLDCSNFSYVEDTQHDHVEALPEYLIMDECSRIDFNRRSKFVDRLKPLTETELIQESWNKLRNCRPELRQYVAAEDGDACRVLELTCGATKLISEADILLSNCQLLSNDSFESSIVSEVSDVFSWCNQQLHLTSTFVQHGFGCYMEDVASLGSIRDCQPGMGFPCEMTTIKTNSMEKADIVRKDRKACRTSPTGPGMSHSEDSEMRSCLDVIQSIVPSRSRLTLRGTRFLEYLSSLGHISRSEASRLSEASRKLKRRRGRTAKHYLSTGAMILTPEDISLLDQCSYYGKISSQASHVNIS